MFQSRSHCSGRGYILLEELQRQFKSMEFTFRFWSSHNWVRDFMQGRHYLCVIEKTGEIINPLQKGMKWQAERNVILANANL